MITIVKKDQLYITLLSDILFFYNLD